MIFNSLSYLFFLSALVVIYYLVPGRWRWVVLILASVAYYLSFIPVFLAIITVLVVVNYFLGFWMAKNAGNANNVGNGGNECNGINVKRSIDRRKKVVLTCIVVVNLVILAFFKNFNFLFPDVTVSLNLVDWIYWVDPITWMIIPLGFSKIV